MARKLEYGVNDLKTQYPEIAVEWDSKKNGNLTPDMVSMGSHTRVWWKCSNGHGWVAPVYRRTGKNKSGCPLCCGHSLLKGKNDLQTVYPEIAKEWNWEKNEDLKPDEVAGSTNKKVWWKGPCGHEWVATVNSRTGRDKSGCPVCANREVLSGYNDLQTVYPEIAKEWNYEKNEDLKPDKIVYGSNKRVWWKCERGHEWKTSLNHRVTRHDGCPECQKEMKSSFPEQCILYYLSKVYPDAENGNRSVLNGLELDVYISSQLLAVEFDGGAFHVDPKKDADKFALCEEKGIRLIRVRDSSCIDLPGFEDHIIVMKSYNDAGITDMLKRLCETICIDVDIDIERDRSEIYAQYILSEKENSLANKFPDIAKEWSERNGVLKPEKIRFGSNKKVLWKCNKGHEWEAVVSSRTGKEQCGCPICSNKKLLSGYNDLKTTFPEIAKEWNYNKNGTLTPEEILGGTHKKVWWNCKLGHEWEESVDSRTGRNLGCPFCANRDVWKGFNDLQTVYPDIAKEWNTEKNGDLKPDMVVFGSNKNVWWKCEKGHEWPAMINSRTGKRKSGCPICSGKRVLKGYNDLQTVCPEIASEWNVVKNGSRRPDMVTRSSNKTVWWKCEKGHEWPASINSRTGKRKNGCPVCANRKVLEGYNDLLSLFPSIAREWNYEKNGDLTPDKFVYGSGKRVWWKCDHGHEWEARIVDRTSNSGRGANCPFCSCDKK